MTEMTMIINTPGSRKFTNPIARKFFEQYDAMNGEYQKTGIVPSHNIFKIIGNPPSLPDSPDTDVLLEGHKNLIEYFRIFKNIQSKVKGLPQKGA